MRLCVFIEPQNGASYDDQLAVARRAEECGFDAFFRSDHFLTMSRTGLPGPTDSWVTLGALARETSTIRLGTLVSSATFRLPGPLAIAVAQVDQMSNGRVDFGLGTGWFEAEHTAYGIPFPPVGERFDRLEEQLGIVTGLWFAVRHYTLVDSPALPKPVQQPVHVIVGGAGPKRTPALAARFAAEYNVPFQPLDRTRDAFDRVRALVDRPIVLSMAQTVAVGRDAAEVKRRVAAAGRMAENGLSGTPSELVDRLGEFGVAGATRAFLQILDLQDLDHLDLIASEVMPHLR
ncbi:LLM class F420-dependent oxidoreductase [Virgisporangium aurantiacum]